MPPKPRQPSNVVDLQHWISHRNAPAPPCDVSRLPYVVFDFELWAAWQQARSGRRTSRPAGSRWTGPVADGAEGQP